MKDDLVGPARLRRGEGFALRRGIWCWALQVAAERRDAPVGLARRGGPRLEPGWYHVGGGRLHARASPRPAAASATPVVLVHGVVVSSRYLLPAAVELAAEFPVLVPDLPGYGLSDGWPSDVDLGTLADATIACALAAGYERISLVGNSFGAQVAVEAALRHPERVERVALLGPSVDPSARSLLRQYARWQATLPDEHPSALFVLARDVADVGLRQALRMLRLMLDDPIEEKLLRVQCPALVVRGGRDRVVPARWAEQVAELLPRGRLEVVPGYGHMAHYSGPLAVAPVLSAFLRGESERAVAPDHEVH